MSGNYRWKLWRLELLAYWHQKGKQDAAEWGPFIRLVLVTLMFEAIIALRIMGALRPLSSLF